MSLFYSNTSVVLQEVPDEISLAFMIQGCPYHCYNCHSSELWDTNLKKNKNNFGKLLSCSNVLKEIEKVQGLVSCILFLGGDWDLVNLRPITTYLKQTSDRKIALYGYNELSYYLNDDIPKDFNSYVNNRYLGNSILYSLDYLKTGKYIESLGGLKYKITNQRFYEINSNIQGTIIKNLTYKFWR